MRHDEDGGLVALAARRAGSAHRRGPCCPESRSIATGASAICATTRSIIRFTPATSWVGLSVRIQVKRVSRPAEGKESWEATIWKCHGPCRPLRITARAGHVTARQSEIILPLLRDIWLHKIYILQPRGNIRKKTQHSGLRGKTWQLFAERTRRTRSRAKLPTTGSTGCSGATRSTVAQETTSSTVMGVTIGFWADWETTSSTAATASTI